MKTEPVYPYSQSAINEFATVLAIAAQVEYALSQVDAAEHMLFRAKIPASLMDALYCICAVEHRLAMLVEEAAQEIRRASFLDARINQPTT